jgi:hypothetical protein
VTLIEVSLRKAGCEQHRVVVWDLQCPDHAANSTMEAADRRLEVPGRAGRSLGRCRWVGALGRVGALARCQEPSWLGRCQEPSWGT